MKDSELTNLKAQAEQSLDQALIRTKEEVSKRLLEQFNVQKQNIFDEYNRKLSAKDKEMEALQARNSWLMVRNEAWALAQVKDTDDDDAMIEETGNDDNNETTGELAKANLTRQYHQRF